jgi:hypothetical protein
MREAQGYNYSIYLMAGTPYLLVAGLGFGVYRNLKRKALLDQELLRLEDGKTPPSGA